MAMRLAEGKLNHANPAMTAASEVQNKERSYFNKRFGKGAAAGVYSYHPQALLQS
jgi:hypothetical protein